MAQDAPAGDNTAVSPADPAAPVDSPTPEKPVAVAPVVPPPSPTHNLDPGKFIADLNSAGTAIEQLKHLATRLEARAIETVNWYLRKKKWPQRLSQWVRGLTILLAIVGGIMPLISGAFPLPSSPPASNAAGLGGLSLDRFGYLFIAAAAAIMMTDKYFGFSTAWMRYMTAQMALQRALEKFQLAWAVWLIQVGRRTASATDTLSPELANDAVLLLSNFQTEIGALVDQEFQLWVAEFKEQLANLQNAISKEKEDQRPGNVVVMISYTGGLAEPSKIYVDDRLAESTTSSATLLNGISAGSHLVMVKAKSGDGKPLEGSQLVTVTAGQTTKAEITLSVPVGA